MKVIFVGLHNKPGKMPLCSSTKSGKLIGRIIERLQHKCITVRKTNLFDVDYLPTEKERQQLAFDWIERVELNQNDVVVLLGAMTHDYFPKIPAKTIKVAHPASKRSHIEMNWYVEDTLSKILRNSEQTPDECDATKAK